MNSNEEIVQELEKDKKVEEIEVELNFEDADDVKTKCFIEDVYVPRHPDVDDVAECHVSSYARRLDNNEVIILTEEQIEKVEEQFWKQNL